MIVDSGIPHRRSIASSLTVLGKLSCFLAIQLGIDSTLGSARRILCLDWQTEIGPPSISLFPRDYDASTMLSPGDYTVIKALVKVN